MMSPWINLNFKGKLLCVGCVLNVLCAVTLAVDGHMLAIFSILMAAFCGVCTYSPHYQHQDAKDINDGREK